MNIPTFQHDSIGMFFGQKVMPTLRSGQRPSRAQSNRSEAVRLGEDAPKLNVCWPDSLHTMMRTCGKTTNSEQPIPYMRNLMPVRHEPIDCGEIKR